MSIGGILLINKTNNKWVTRRNKAARTTDCGNLKHEINDGGRENNVWDDLLAGDVPA